MATTIRTSDNVYSNGSMSSNFTYLNDWFASFKVCIYLNTTNFCCLFNDVLTCLISFALPLWISEVLMRLIFQNCKELLCCMWLMNRIAC